MERNRAGVLADRRWLRILGCTAALLAAFGCASFFVETARADDPAPSASTTDAGNTSGTATDANAPTADAEDASCGTTGGAVPVPDPDTSANAADGSDAATDSPDTSGTAIGDSDSSTDAPAPSDTTSTGTDGSTVAPGTTPEAAECTDAADTSSPTSGAVPTAASDDSTAEASTTNKRPAGSGSGSDAVNGSTDSVPPPSEPGSADGGSDAPGDSGTLSGDGSSAGSATASSAGPEVPSDLTTIDSLLGESSRGGSTADWGLGGRARSGADTTGSGATPMPASALKLKVDVGGMIRPQVDHRVVVCESAVSASVRFDYERILYARSPTDVDTTQAARSGVRTGEEKGHPDGSRKPGSPVPPAPNNDTPPMPRAPSSLLGSGGSGGIQGKDVKGVVTARFSLIPPRDTRLVTLVEKQRRALRLFFILERPG